MSVIGRDVWMREALIQRQNGAGGTPVIIRFSVMPNVGRALLIECSESAHDEDTARRQVRFLEDLSRILQFHKFACQFVPADQGVPAYMMVCLREDPFAPQATN